MKLCKVCQTEKPNEAFNLKNKQTGELQSKCRECQHAYFKCYYEANRKELISKASVNTQKRRPARRKFMDQLKSKPCLDCGRSFPPCAMQFDHLRDKEFNVSCMLGLGLGTNHILSEIAKCELVCACCHAIRTDARRKK